MISDVLDKIYEILSHSPPAGVKKIFEPGKPPGPFAQNLPAVLIIPAAEAEMREEVSADVEVLTLSAEVHIYTEDVYAAGETRRRGKVADIAAIAQQIVSALKAEADLDFLVDDLEEISQQAAGPAHWWVEVSYTIQRGS